jgi:hypothetical protein
MTHPLHKPLAPTPQDSPYAGIRAIATETGNAVVTAARGTWAFLKVVFNLNGELLRMADEWDATLPEHAARLRAAARKGWDW